MKNTTKTWTFKFTAYHFNSHDLKISNDSMDLIISIEASSEAAALDRIHDILESPKWKLITAQPVKEGK
jgi:succinylarginine dihydrolase